MNKTLLRYGQVNTIATVIIGYYLNKNIDNKINQMKLKTLKKFNYEKNS